MLGSSCGSTSPQYRDRIPRCILVANPRQWPRIPLHPSFRKDEAGKDSLGGLWSGWGRAIGWEARRAMRRGWLRHRALGGGRRACRQCQVLWKGRGGDARAQDRRRRCHLCKLGSTCVCKMPLMADDTILRRMLRGMQKPGACGTPFDEVPTCSF